MNTCVAVLPSVLGSRVDVDHAGSWWVREGMQDVKEGRKITRVFDLACGM